MNYQSFFSKRFFTMMAAAGVIALAPLSRADAHAICKPISFQMVPLRQKQSIQIS